MPATGQKMINALSFFGICKLTSYMRALQKKRRLQVTFVLLSNMISSRPLC